MQTRDRSALNGLHIHSSGASHPPSDLRDASRLDKSPDMVWTKKPVFIKPGQDRLDNRISKVVSTNTTTRAPSKAVPSTVNKPTRTSSASNPYSSGRFQTTLNNRGTSAVGNIVAKQTVFGPTRPLKRQRTDSTAHLDLAGRSTRKVVRASTSANPEVIDLDADTEDVGVPFSRPPSSPDPLNTINGTSSNSRSGKQHDEWEEPFLPRDGPSTRRLQQKLAGDKVRVRDDSDVESIENADDFDDETMFSKTSPTGSVREKINLYNDKSKSGVPVIDLRKKATTKMKGKQPANLNLLTLTLSSKQKDPIATSATKFTGKSTQTILPIEEWYLGTKRLPEKGSDQRQSYGLQLQGTKMTIKNDASGIAFYRLTPSVDADLDSFEHSRDVSDCTVWRFRTTDRLAQPKKNNKFSDPSFTHHFTPGSKGAEGMITIKFHTSGGKGFRSAYQTMTNSLCRMIEHNSSVDERGAVAILEATNRGLDSDVWSDSRKVPKTRGRTSGETMTKKPGQFRRSPSLPERSVECIAGTSEVGATGQKAASTVTKDLLDVIPAPTIRPTRPKPIQRVAENATPGPSVMPRRSTRLLTPLDAQRPPSADLDELILVYPPDGPGAVEITNSDLSRLRPDEFLNDTLIEFGLKLLLNELRDKDPVFAESIYVFSSFFYKKLNKKNLEEGYQSIRKWTLKVDLFKKKYIIVPINENLHWYLAIISGPEYMLRPAPAKPAKTSTRSSQLTRPRLQAPPERLDKPPSHPRIPLPTSPSETHYEDEVEALLHLRSSCSISPPEDDARTISELSDVANNDLGTELEPDVHKEAPEHRPVSPISDLSDDMMDVDQPLLIGQHSRGPSMARSEPVGLDNRDRSRSLEVELISSDVELPDNSTNAFKVGEHRADPLNLRDDDDIMEEVPPVLLKSVQPASFYGTGPTRHNRKAYSCRSRINDVQVNRVEVPAEPVADHNEPETTYIFTLDSLGSQHRQAINTLHRYLKMEAKDKRGIAETSDITGKRASVPVQPNHCDCGIYLLHFARTFMMDPVRYCQAIMSPKPSAERQADWKQEDISGMRERFMAQILSLSEQWKILRTAKEEQRKKEVAEGRDVTEVESSDSEIDIVEDIQEAVTKKPASRLR